MQVYSRLLTVTGLLLLALGVLAAVPGQINYQGVIFDGIDNPLEGTHALHFALYTDSLISEPKLWSEINESVSFEHGLFQVNLGSVTPFDLADFNGTPLWLGIAVDEGVEMIPRSRLNSVPYAFRASVADTALAIPGGVLDGHSLDAEDGSAEDVVYVPTEGHVQVRGGLAVGSGYVQESERPSEQEHAKPSLRNSKPSRSTSRAESFESVRKSVRTSPPENGMIIEGQVGIGTDSPSAMLDVIGIVRADTLSLPTGAESNFVLTSDSTGIASWQPNYGSRVPDIKYADMYPDDDFPTAGDKIKQAILDLPTWGGIVDARGLAGNQSISVNVFEGVSNDLALYLGTGTYIIGVPQIYQPTTTVSLRIIGQGNATILKPTSSMTVLTAEHCYASITDLQIDLNYTNSTAVFFYGVSRGLLEHLYIHNNSGTAPVIDLGVNWASTGAVGAVVQNVHINSCLTANGIDIDAEGVVVDRTLFWGCKAAVSMRAGTSSTIMNSLFWHGIHALIIEEGDGYSSLLFTGNDCESGWSEGYVRIVGSASYYPIVAVTIRDNYFTGIGPPGDDAIYVKNARGLVVEGNRFGSAWASGGQSIVFDTGVSEVCLSGNSVDGISPTMTGHELVGLPSSNVTVTQCSGDAAYGGDLTIDGSLTVGDLIRLQPSAFAPSNPSEGDIYMDDNIHKLMVFDGTTWRACW